MEKVRFESLEPDGFLTASDLGDYRGAMELVRSGSGLGVINDVGVEDYVRGISEVPSSWPTEALRAQAIAARTYGLNQKENPPPSASSIGADICPTEACQVYVGLAKERAEAGERWVAAVESTRGQVLLKKGAPIRAMYYSGALIAPGRQSAPAKPAARAPAKPPAPGPPAAAPPPSPPPPTPPLLGVLPTDPPPPAA
ncbi:MAG: SpoIID/LytB domain-containing protein, partial [Actinomycetota bacterium]|nr:SpoIID/LytB domain-containing protein [Actinomycetota bacterium]